MDTKLLEIRDQQKTSWDKFSPGWKKWDSWGMEFLRPLGNEIIRYLDPEKEHILLDVATGTGEPGLTLAGMVSNGHVVGTDISAGMLQVAKEKAIQQGIHNYRALECDVTEMPFDDDTFDGISCRMGYMFFPDILLATGEMVRVLKPGGRMAATVWGRPDNNIWVTSIMGPIMKNMEIQPPPPGSPGIFRCAEPGLMATLFRQSGLEDVGEKKISGLTDIDSLETFWQFMNDVAAPIVSALEKADERLRTRIKQETMEILSRDHQESSPLTLEYEAYLVYGRKQEK